MTMGKNFTCRCGNRVVKLQSYFEKSSGLRITVCDNCANDLKLNDTVKFDKVKFTELTQEQNKTPELNGK